MSAKYKVAKRRLLSPETLRFADGRVAVFSAVEPEHVLELEEREAQGLRSSGHEVEKVVIARKKAKQVKDVKPDPEPVKEEKENDNGA